jgi:hypothetical protein
VDVDLFARAGSQQILLRLAHFFAAEDTHRAGGDGDGAIGNRAV